MSYGSDTYGGAAEGVGGADFGGSPSYGGGGNPYSFDTSSYAWGAQAPTAPSTDFGFPSSPSSPSGFDADFSLGGSYAPSGYSDWGYAPSDMWSLAPESGMLDFGSGAGAYGLGAQATTVPGLDTQLGTTSTTDPFADKDRDSFWGSKAQKALSFLSNFNPITRLVNAGVSAYNAKDPVRAGIQSLAGLYGGDVGRLANMGYNIGTSKDPGATGAGYLGGFLGGQLGGSIAGGPGAQLGSEALGGFLSDAARSPSYSRTAEAGMLGSVTGDMMAGLGTGGYGAPSMGSPQGDSSGSRNWTDTAMSLLSGAYGMKQASAQRALAQQAAVPSAAAGAAMQKVIAGDFTGDAGFEAAQKAAARAGSQQPGGFAASAAAQAALKYQNDRIATLAGASGSGNGYTNALSGMNSASETARAALGNINFGVAGGGGTTQTAMPPWLQAYLVTNGMRGTSNA